MSSILTSIYMNYTNVLKMSLFNYLKTGDQVYDTIVSTILIGFFSYIINYIYENQISINNFTFNINNIKYYFYKKNSIILEGKRSSVICPYNQAQNISSSYSKRFKAMWNYIISNIENNSTIYKIKEAHTNFQNSESAENRKKTLDMFMVFQNNHFTIDEHIFAKSELENEESRDEKEKINSKTDKITVTIYSYVYSLNYLTKYVDDITNNYLSSIKNSRNNKKFIYSLDKVKVSDEETSLDCWREDIFESYRTFKNIFFDGKVELLQKINFFLSNSDWYREKGINYSLGIGLHGPPGTGKTSFIKALANLTDRNIIQISLKMFKTKKQLEHFFFESTYNSNNEKGSITFDKKIIVFEDIDCIGDIVIDRNTKNKERQSKNKNLQLSKDNIKISDILNSINEMNGGCEKICVNNLNEEHPITLDDILNLWDGIRETPGRILIISSNHYDKLDPALIRPGRIDITHEFSNASHNVISEMYFHLFGKKIDQSNLKKIKPNFYSPAEIINIYVSNMNECDFIKKIIQNKKI